jgi:hypothetical protein
MPASKPNITFGADPEFLVFNQQGNLVPSWLLGVEGTKKAPSQVKGLENYHGFGVLQDGVALELNINPTDKVTKLASHINYCLKNLNGGGVFKIKTAKVNYDQTEVEVPLKYRDHPGFTEIGCTVDLDAFRDEDKQVRPPFGASDMGAMRYTGGHLHVGCDPWPEWLPKRVFVQLLSTCYTSLIPENHPQGRETPYGVEYRSPTTKWLSMPGPYLEALDKQIKRILTVEDDTHINGLARIYQQGSLSEFRYAFDRGSFRELGRLAGVVDNEINDVLSGKRYRIQKPAKLELEGYRREVEPDNVREIRGVGGGGGLNDDPAFFRAYNIEAQVEAPRAPGTLPLFQNYGFNLVPGGGPVDTQRLTHIWNWVIQNYPQRAIRYSRIDYLEVIEEGEFEDYHKFRMPPPRPGAVPPEDTVIVIASGTGQIIKIWVEATNEPLYDILGDHDAEPDEQEWQANG